MEIHRREHIPPQISETAHWISNTSLLTISGLVLWKVKELHRRHVGQKKKKSISPSVHPLPSSSYLLHRVKKG